MAGYGRRPCLTPDTIWVQSHSIWKKRKQLHKIRHIGSALIGGGGGEEEEKGSKFNNIVH